MTEPYTNGCLSHHDRRVSLAPLSHPNLQGYPERLLRLYAKNREVSQRYEFELPIRKEFLRTHFFTIAALLCIDGRVQDFASALGLALGMLEPYRSAGAKSNLKSAAYRSRRSVNLHRVNEGYRSVDRMKGGEIAMFTVHYSESHPSTASCAAWGHQTDKALETATKLADEYNDAFQGRQVVGFPVLIDTDLDALTVIGPAGRIRILSLLDRPETQNGTCREYLESLLREIFPASWTPLQRLLPEFRENFYPELAERLEANILFARTVRDNHRPIELLDHQETLVFVGRHADAIPGHNEVFLVDDTDEKAEVTKGYTIGLKYVTRNVLNDVIKTGDRDWRIPVAINIPYDKESARHEAVFVARNVYDDLHAALDEFAVEISDWVLDGEHGLAGQIPDWLYKDARPNELRKRVFFALSTSFRKKRLYEPVER
ncbi:hypothetical protein KBC59_02860 [Patescibacteria group bacterium]|nr:hypothetical protein [Patescibacteria group bacterium]